MEKKSNFSIRRLIYNDKYLLLVSLVLAVVVWIGASLSAGTMESKTIKVHTSIALGDEVSEQLGMQYYSLQDNMDLSVTITGAKYVIGQVTDEDLSIVFDTSSVNRTGAQTIPILVNNASRSLDFDVQSVYPSSIEGYFDVNESKVMDIDLRYDDTCVADGYIFGDPVLSEDKVVVSGPKSYIDRLESVVADVDFGTEDGLTEMYKNDCELSFEGAEIESNYFTVTSRNDKEAEINKVSVTIPVLKKTVLPVSVDYENKPSDLNTNAMKVTYSRSEVNAAVLDSADITEAVIGTVDFNNLAVGRNEIEFNTTKINGIKVLDDVNTISVTIYVSPSYREQTITIKPDNIDIEGVEEGKSAKINSVSTTTVKIVAPYGVTINPSDVSLKCDVSDVKEDGVYPVSIDLKNSRSWVFGKYTAKITIE